MSTPTTDKIKLCIEDLITRVQSIAAFGPAVEFVADPKLVFNRLKMIPGDWCGVVYEGSRASPEQGAARQGLGASLMIGLYVVADGSKISKMLGTEMHVVDVLHEMRDTILGKTSPTGHPWRWSIERFVDEEKNRLLWQQVWETKCIHEIPQGS